MRERLVIYHGPDCLDGFTAAWVLHQRFAPDTVEYHPAAYGTDPPWQSIEGRDVYIVDFSYPRAALEIIKEEAHMLVVLDHHATAEADLAGLPYAIFDMGRSGAGLTWDWAFMGRPRPWLVDYVEDGDLWQFKLEGSRGVRCWLTEQPKTFEVWDRLSEMPLGEALRQGEIALHRMESYVRAKAQQAKPLTLSPFTGLVVEASRQRGSELMHHLLVEHPWTDFAARAEQGADGEWEYSVRSRAGVAREIAEARGGGGHANAAGFRSRTQLH